MGLANIGSNEIGSSDGMSHVTDNLCWSRDIGCLCPIYKAISIYLGISAALTWKDLSLCQPALLMLTEPQVIII